MQLEITKIITNKGFVFHRCCQNFWSIDSSPGIAVYNNLCFARILTTIDLFYDKQNITQIQCQIYYLMNLWHGTDLLCIVSLHLSVMMFCNGFYICLQPCINRDAENDANEKSSSHYGNINEGFDLIDFETHLPVAHVLVAEEEMRRHFEDIDV